MIRLEMKNCDVILTEKLQKYQRCHIVKLINMSILWGGKIIPRDQRRIIKQARFANYPLGKVFEEQLKSIEDHGKKQVEALTVLALIWVGFLGVCNEIGGGGNYSRRPQSKIR